MSASPHALRSSSRLRAWLTLFRIPNFFTLPGEALAGAVLAAKSDVFTAPLAWTLMALVAFYGGGLAWNDYYDRGRDRRSHPQRPIPSGTISARAAFIAGSLLVLLGLLICAYLGLLSLAIGASLVCAIFAYDRILKRVPVFGELAMGLCRGLSVLLGAAAMLPHGPFPVPVLVLSISITGYISIITYLAKREARAIHPGAESSAPLIFLLLAGTTSAIAFEAFPGSQVYALLAYSAALLVSMVFSVRMWRLRSTPNLPLALQRKQTFKQVMPAWIGRLIGALLFIHLAVILFVTDPSQAMPYVYVLLSCWIINRWLTRWFYAS